MTLERPVQELPTLEDNPLAPRRLGEEPVEEFGFPEVRELIRRNWKLILGLGLLFGLLTAGVVLFLLPDVYEATARLTVHPPAAGSPSRSVTVYTSLLESEGVLERTSQQLVREGVLPEDGVLVLGEQVIVEALNGSALDAPRGSSIVTVTGRSERPAAAAAIANTMAENFIMEARPMLRSTAEDSEAVLAEELAPTRVKLEQAEAAHAELLDDFQAREEEISTSWDRRISATESAGVKAAADYQTQTRQLMVQALGEHAPPMTADVQSRLLEVVAVRAQLAQTPRVQILEKAASDETLAELLVAAKGVELFDGTLVSEQLDPLYDQLSLRVLELESELKSAAGADAPALAAVLTRLEEIQLERAAGLAALENGTALDLRIQRRRRSRALEDLLRERDTAVAEIQRQIDQLSGLEQQLSEGFNKALISRLLEDVEVVHLAARAVPRQVAEPRDLGLKTAAAVFLGAMLGLMIALFRSASSGARSG